MTKPWWVIENIVREKSFLELSRAAHELGYPVLDIKGDYAKSMLIELPYDTPIIINGSIAFVKMLEGDLAEMGRKVVMPTTRRNYDCSTFYPIFNEFLFNDNFVFVPLNEVARRKYFFYGLFGREALMFIRPDSGDKSFKGGVVDLLDFDRFYSQFEHLKHDMVVVSSPKNIRGEWRFVVGAAGREIIAQSCYQFQGQHTEVPSAPVGATELVHKLLAVGEYPDAVFCFDIAEDNDGNYWLLEVTSFASAGLYAANKRAIVSRVSEIANRFA